MTKKMVCIECPKGCVLSVDVEAGAVTKVLGAKCPKGIGYAAAEITDPSRILTSTVMTEGLALKLVPVRTDRPIPKGELFRAMEEIKRLRIDKPLKAGDTIAENFLGLHVRLVATREVVR